MSEARHLSSDVMDLLSLASLKEDEAEAARAHIAACADCRARFEEMEQDKAHFSQVVLPRTVKRVRERAATPSRPKWAAWLTPAAGLAFAATVAIVVVRPDTTPSASYLGLKGTTGATLKVIADREGRQFEVSNGAQLKAGDRLRFKVTPGSAQYLLVATRDAKGARTVLYPFGGTRSAALPRAEGPPATLELPPGESVRLDDSLGEEHFVAVFSNQPVTVEQLDTTKDAFELHWVKTP
ncbi:MAG: hypothetical protein ACT4TC_13165 [Myxococcaceae bacterium]